MTRRARRTVEVASALLILPLAVAVTIAVVVAPATPARHDATPTLVSSTASPTVSLEGGEPVAAFGLADELSGHGFDVVAVGPDQNSFGPTTQVVYYERSHRADAERLRDLLGVGTIRREQVFSPSADLTVFIGKDLQST